MEQINEKLRVLRENAAKNTTTERVKSQPIPPPDRSLREPDTYLGLGGNAGRCEDYEEVLRKANEGLADRGIEDATGSMLSGATGALSVRTAPVLNRDLVVSHKRPDKEFVIVTVYHGAGIADRICGDIRENGYLANLTVKSVGVCSQPAILRHLEGPCEALEARRRKGKERSEDGLCRLGQVGGYAR